MYSSVSQFSCSVVTYYLWPHQPQHARPPCPSPTPGVHPNPCPLSRWCHPTISSSVIPFSSYPHPFPASESFPMSQLFTSGGQSIRVSASTSVPPMNTQNWSPLGWTGWISLQSKGLSRVFSNTTVQKHQFFSLSFLYSPTLTSIHDYWKNHSLDYMDLCQQSNVSAFYIHYQAFSFAHLIYQISNFKTVKVCSSLSHVKQFVTPWTAAYQASPSMGFSRQEYWSGLSLPSPYDQPR